MAIAGASNAVDPACQAYLVLISGDIAYSGKALEYEQGLTFIHELKSQLETLKTRPFVAVYAIPGNHDCDFALAGDTRKLLVEFSPERLKEYDLNGDLFRSCLVVQDEFFNFHGRLHGEPPTAGSARFAWKCTVQVGGEKVVINSINSAWLSQLHEEQGKLWFPSDRAFANWDESHPGILSVTMVHHPFNWFNADSARELRQRIEALSDVVLTGHEHSPNAFTKELFSGETIHYFEGGVLQDSTDMLRSSFKVIVVDTDLQTIRPVELAWQSGMYLELPESGAVPLRKRALTSLDRFPLSDELTKK